jgi:predicted transposase/invertase (TIGR01784 family)
MALSVLNDLLFKKCFNSADHPEVPQNFISDVLGLEIEDITLESPYDICSYTDSQGSSDLRTTEVDVLVRLGDQRLITVELQRQPQTFYIERSAYYLSSRYVKDYGRMRYQRLQGTGDEKYSSLYPVYSINIVDFLLFAKDVRAFHHFAMSDLKTGALLKDEGLLHLCYIELGKQPPANLKDWVDFFNGKQMRADVPAYIQQAYALVDYANLDESERDMISAAERREQDMIGYLNFAEARGRALGSQDALLQTARNLLAQGVSPEVIQGATGLSSQQIEQLR